MTAVRWDIFCKVVDNYGDIGVCWRLARQLRAEHGARVCLWVDDLGAFARLAPAIDRECSEQVLGDLTVRHWTGEIPAGACDATDVVIEAFGCGLPDSLLEAFAARDRPPVWINLEYLSAETWVRGAHGLASPHPRLPLVRHFFFPGFHADTAGLLAERDLLAQRRAWQADAGAQAAFWQRIGVPGRTPGEVRVSLFGYPGAPLEALLAHWARGKQSITAVIPDGVFPAAGSGVRGALSIARYPFLHQDDFDRLLWSCDLNFVRGEDSLVRALWAGRPLVWQIYPQEKGAHFAKLDAFLDLWLAGRADAHALRALHDAWNGRPGAAGIAAAWTEFAGWAAGGAGGSRLPAVAASVDFADALLARSGLAARLTDFVAALRQS